MSLSVFSERKSSKERALTQVIPAMEPARIAMRSVAVVTPNKRHKRIIIVETNAASTASRRFVVLILVIRTFETSIISVAKSRNHNCFSIFSSLFFVKKMNYGNIIITENKDMSKPPLSTPGGGQGELLIFSFFWYRMRI
jgi:hypothetical protein